MKVEIDIPEPPQGFEIVEPGPSLIGDMYLTADGWMEASPGFFQAIRARRKKVGLVETLDSLVRLIEIGLAWGATHDKLRARLAAIEREPTDEESVKWKLEYAPHLTNFGARAAMKAAREIGRTP